MYVHAQVLASTGAADTDWHALARAAAADHRAIVFTNYLRHNFASHKRHLYQTFKGLINFVLGNTRHNVRWRYAEDKINILPYVLFRMKWKEKAVLNLNLVYFVTRGIGATYNSPFVKLQINPKIIYLLLLRACLPWSKHMNRYQTADRFC